MYFSWGGQARPGLSGKVALKPRPYEGEGETGRWNIPGRTRGPLAMTMEGACCLSRTESPVRLAHIRGCQRPFSRSSLGMVPPFPASLAAEYLGPSSQQWDAKRWSVLGPGVLKRWTHLLTLWVSSWLHLGPGSQAAWTPWNCGAPAGRALGPWMTAENRATCRYLDHSPHPGTRDREKTSCIL